MCGVVVLQDMFLQDRIKECVLILQLLLLLLLLV